MNVPVGTFQRYVPTGTLDAVFHLEHWMPFANTPPPFQSTSTQDALNVPTGTLSRLPAEKLPECSDWNIEHVLHTISTSTW
jgi:hypothetical protein